MSDEIAPREIGESGIAEMVAAFYRRVRKDDLPGPLYPEQDEEASERRLRDF